MRPFFNAGGVLILVLLLIGGAATYAHFGIGDRQAMLDRDAVTVQAIVTDKQERRRLGGSGTASTDYFVSVRITEGSAIDGTLSLRLDTAQVRGRFYNSVEEGQAINVRILPGDDDVIEIDPGWNEGNSVASLIMAGLCFATAGLFSWLILRNAKMTRKVETEGITAQAEILSAQTSGGYVNVKVRFDTSGGETG